MGVLAQCQEMVGEGVEINVYIFYDLTSSHLFKNPGDMYYFHPPFGAQETEK